MATRCYLLLEIMKLLLHLLLQSSSDGVEIMHANVDEVTRTCQCILRIFYLFQLYLSHKSQNSQGDHPKRTDWYADLILPP